MRCMPYKNTISSCNTEVKPYAKAIIFASVFFKVLKQARGCWKRAKSIFSGLL